MRISPVQNISFKSGNDFIYKNIDTGKDVSRRNTQLGNNYRLKYKNTTMFFRKDLSDNNRRDWSGFRKAVADMYRDTDKVNVYDFAASDGSEAFSFIISMIEEVGREEAKKFFPVKAYDIDESMVKRARRRKIQADFKDIDALDKNTESGMDDYFKFSFTMPKSSSPYCPYPYFLEPKEKISGAVKFNQGNFLEKIDDIEPENSIVLCRNFLPYVDSEEREKALGKLLEKLDSSSLVVTGNFDRNCRITDIVENHGYEEISRNVWRKKS